MTTAEAGAGVGSPQTARVRLDVSYLGGDFHGFAENRGVRTVGGTLRTAIERVLQHPVAVTCAGRTDAGVHARGQVVSLDVQITALDRLAAGDRRGRVGVERLRDSVNGLVGPTVVIHAATVVGDDFDARFSATCRTYRYTVWNATVPDPFLSDRAWWVDDPLDLVAMDVAAAHLVGEHDFSSFCRRPKPSSVVGEPPSLVRRVLAASWTVDADEVRMLTFTVTATAFCHQMVRSITGLLVDVGRGRRTTDDVRVALEAGDRARAGQLAPPHGLLLWDVGY